MLHPLQQRVRAVGRIIQRLMMIRAASWMICILGILGVLLALIDFGLYVGLKLDDKGVRIIFAVTYLVIVVVAAKVKVWPMLAERWSDIQLARRIEQRIPFMRDRLSSAINFLEQDVDDPTAGSYALRRTVIADAEAKIDPLELKRMLRYRPTILIAAGAAVVLASIVGLLVFFSPARLAAQRLALPWSDAPWPKRNSLYFEEPPTKMIAGKDLELRLKDANGRLPEIVDFYFSLEGDRRTQQRAMKRIDDSMVVRLENVTQSLKYQAIGGDHTMNWRGVEVVPAPAVTEMEFTLRPPEYTGWTPVASGRDIRGLQGSRVDLQGKVNKPLTKMDLRIETAEGDQTFPLQLGSDGVSFALPVGSGDEWVIQSPGKYWLEMTDEHGLVGGGNEVWSIQPIADEPPTIALESPNTKLHVTPIAIVPLAALVTDDLGIQSVELRYLLPGKTDEGEQTVVIQTGPETPAPNERAPQTTGEVTSSVSYQWDLSSLGLIPDQPVDFFLAASDYKPQFGMSPRRQLIVLSAPDFEDRVGQKQTYLLQQLAEALRLQKEARLQVTSLEIQLAETGGMQKEDIDALQAAELNQRQVQRLLAGDNGVESQIVGLLAELDISQVDSPDVRRRMSLLLAELRRIEQEHLTSVQREFINSLKISRGAMGLKDSTERALAFEEVGPPLTTVGVQQDDVIEALERLLGEYREWDDFRRFGRDMRRIQRKQDAIREQTTRLSGGLIGKRPEDLSPQERAELGKLAQQQSVLSREFEAIRSRMQEMQQELSENDPLVSRTLSDAIESALDRAIGGQMREVGRDISNNRRGHALQLQQEITEGLKDVTDILANRREQELERLVEKLQESARTLEGLRNAQSSLNDAMEAVANLPDETERERELQRLQKEQQQLAEQAERLGRQLQRLQAEQASQSARQAGQSMRQSAQSAGQGSRSEAGDQARQALSRLEDAQRSLEQALAQAERELYQERLVQLRQKIEGLVARQQNVISEITRLKEVLDEVGSLSHSQLASLGSISREQRSLATESGSLADEVADAEAFALGLRGAVRSMLRTTRALDQQELSPSTLDAAGNALARLQQLVQALQNDDQPPEAPEPGSGQGDQQQPESDAIQVLSQLKLLQLMQQEINRRTGELEELKLRRGGSLTDEQKIELDELAVEQGQLADLLFNLAEPAVSNPEDDPESLPDLREEGKPLDGLDSELEKSLDIDA